MALITTIEELKEFSPAASLSIKHSSVLPSYTHVESYNIVPIIGKAQYDSLHAAYLLSIAPVPTPLTAAEAKLLSQVRKVLVPFSISHYRTTLLSRTSEAGSFELTPENSTPVRMWVNSLQTNLLESEGLFAEEALLQFLETNKADYALWVASESFTQLHSCLLQTAVQFNEEVNINNSRKFFRSIRPEIKYAEQMVLRKNIGALFYKRLLDSLKDNSTTADEKVIIGMIYPIVANFAIATTVLPIQFDNNGAVTISSDLRFSGNQKTEKEPNDPNLYDLKTTKLRIGQQYLDELISYLNANARSVLFPAYFNSINYVAPTTTPPLDPNENYNAIFVI